MKNPKNLDANEFIEDPLNKKKPESTSLTIAF